MNVMVAVQQNRAVEWNRASELSFWTQQITYTYNHQPTSQVGFTA